MSPMRIDGIDIDPSFRRNLFLNDIEEEVKDSVTRNKSKQIENKKKESQKRKG